MATTSPNDVLRNEVEDLLISAVWTHQIQEKQTIVSLSLDDGLKVTQIILSALTGSTAIVEIVNSSIVGKVIITALSAILVVVGTILKSNSFGHKAELHKLAAAKLWLIRRQITSALVDFAETHIDAKELRKKRDQFISDLFDVSKMAPKAGLFAKRAANKALKFDGVSTVSQEERDILLPKYLGR